MTDRIKIFIQQHRSEFDAALPGTVGLPVEASLSVEVLTKEEAKAGWSGVQQALDRLQTADRLERTLLYDRLLLDTAEPQACVWDNIAAALEGKTAPTDDLECFIRHHRDDLDQAVPDLRVWGNIEQSIPAAVHRIAKMVKVDWQRRLLRTAASVALLVVGMGLGLWYARSADATTANGGMAMGEVSAEYKELEDFYRRDIAVKEEKLARFTGNQPDEIEGDLAQMDKVMTELRQELADVPPGNREQVVRVMIENYKAKSAILQRVLQHLETFSPDQPQNSTQHEKARI